MSGGIGESKVFQNLFTEALSRDDKESLLIRNCRFCRPPATGGSEEGGSAEAKGDNKEVKEDDEGVQGEGGDVEEGEKRNDKERHCGSIWLHALRYERSDPATPELNWAFQTSTPEWAVDGYVEEGV
jgi:hypothetical protein